MISFKTKNTALTIIFSMISFVLYAQERVVPPSEIPSEINTFIKTHFPTHTVRSYKFKIKGKSKKYEAKLHQGVELKFNNEFQLTEIESKSRIPNGIIPQQITQYVAENYPNNYIEEWELKRKYQKVELDNGIDLKFGLSNEFIKVD